MTKKTGDMTFETAIQTLEEIVEKLENGELTLEESLTEFQQGIELYKYCYNIINNTEGKISLLLQAGDGKIIETDFDKEIGGTYGSETGN